METIKKKFVNYVRKPIDELNGFNDESPVVSGQSISGAELFRRQSSGLPVGCAIRQFNQINPYLEKFSIYDSIGSFKLRHGMLDNSMLVTEKEKEPNKDLEPNGDQKV